MANALTLDLMELDGKATPMAIADEIFRQNPSLQGPIPIEEFARLAGIEKIAELTTEGFEGALITNPEKSRGVIMVKAGVNPQRRRFTIGHELGHFLLPWHRQTSFNCKQEDIKDSSDGIGRTGTVGVRQDIEAEANAFASELLMPRLQFKARLKSYGEPELKHLLELAANYDSSVEATVWRYKALSDYPVAFVFSHNNVVRYWTRAAEFPYTLCVRKGQSLPTKSPARQNGQGISDWDEVDSYLWLEASRRKQLPDTVLEQTLYQQDGYKLTLLYIEELPEEDEDD